MDSELSNKAERREMVVACIEDHPKAMALLRTARSRAQSLGNKWSAVFIETPQHLKSAEDGTQERILRLFTLTKQMGGETIHIEADSTEQGMGHLLQKHQERIALLVIGNIEPEGHFDKLRRSRAERIIRLVRKHNIPVEIVPLFGQYYQRNLFEKLRKIQLLPIVYALVAVGIAFICASALELLLPPALFRINARNIELLFMIACAFAAGRFGLLPGLFASAASSLAVNYYFTVPYHALKLGNITDTLNIALFFAAALLISLFTSQTRGYAQKAARREVSTQALFTIYRIASVQPSRQKALEKLQDKLTRMLEVDVVFFLPEAMNSERVEPVYPRDIVLEKADRQALDLCWKEMATTGLASPVDPGTKWRFEPMLAPGGEIGVLGIKPHRKGKLDNWFGQLLSAIADQTAAVIEHIELEHSMEATRISEEREKLRAMLLSSVSHDLKTPLASIIGALGIYRSQNKQLGPEKRQILIDTAFEEATRLDSFITNILDITRLESGKVAFKPEWHNAHDIVRDVVRRMEHRLRLHQMVIHSGCENVEVYADVMMTQQVLQNIFDNACKYTPPGTLIQVTLREDGDKSFICEVHDKGAGLPADKLDRVFDKYARLQMRDSQVAGTGLGLAICKAIMTAQSGSISASNHPEGGAIFTVLLPQWRKANSTKYVA